jgi:glycosyltransferase involved in cell wall biosynthesis
MKKISIVSPTFNEEGNVELLYQRINEVMAVQTLDYEIIFIDNDSTDNTVSILRGLASRDKRVKLILNATNFGHIRSPYYGLLQTNSDASVLIASDLQDPPELLGSLIEEWERGAPIVLAVKSSSDESWPWRMFRRVFYKAMSKLAQAPLVRNATGAGLFDKKVIDQLKLLEDPYPYFRGLVTELGFPVATVEFHQTLRHSGKTKNNWITLYDIAILGLTTYGGAAIRLISLFGFFVAILSFFASLIYFVAKLLFWDSFELGLAPLILAVFFFGSVQIVILGLLGEYLSNIQRRIRKLPLVIEAERVNF